MTPSQYREEFPSKRPILSEYWEQISFKWPVADFSDRYSFRWKWFRTYLRPIVVQKQQVWSHMKYSPIDLKPIVWQVAPQNGPFGQNLERKISFKWPVADFSDRHSFRWKWFRTYLRPIVVQKQQVWSHMKYSPNDHQSIPLEIHQKMSKNTKKIHIIEPRWPVEHIQQAIYAK